MKPYIPKIGCCCPGHDDFSSTCYNNRRSQKAKRRMTKKGHRIVRRTAKLDLKCEAVRPE